MNLFSKSINKSPKKTKKSKISTSEESSTPRLRSQSRENTASKPKVSKTKSDKSKQASTSHRTLRSSNKAPTSPSFSFDLDSHPLNLPPDQRRKLSALSKMSDPERMDEDTEISDAALSSSKSQASPTTPSDTPKTNSASTTMNESVPIPPPHKSNASSPIVITTTSVEDAEIYKTAGNKYYKAKEFNKAIVEYSKAVAAQPSSATYLSNRAAAYISNGQYTQALEDCLRASQLDPQNSKILLRLARIYTNLGRPQEALDVYTRMDPPASAKDIAPSRDMQKHIKGAEDALKHSTTGSMAIHALDQAEKLLGPGAQKPRKWQLMRGEALLKIGNENSLGNAQNIAMSLLRINSADPEALVLRGRILYAQGDNSKAVSHLRQAINCDPDYQEAVKYLRIVQKLERTKSEGNSEYKSGKYKEAISKYSEALEIDPLNKGTNSKLLQNRALCHIQLRNFNAAIIDCEQAITLDPSYTKAKKTKATAVGQSGDWESAIREWKELLESDPQNPSLIKELRAAEKEQKKCKRKDYYKILGLEKDADANQIKKAYRKAAIIHHPDKNPDDESAAERFKDIGEAYETLSDPEKKARYDNGDDLVDPTEAFGGGMQGMGIDPEILMQMFGSQMGGGTRTTFSFGGDPSRHRGPPPGFTFR